MDELFGSGPFDQLAARRAQDRFAGRTISLALARGVEVPDVNA
jgi:hypothetical protein